MELLVLGGTAFPGPEIVASAQRRARAWWTRQHSGEYVWGAKAGQLGLTAERELDITTEWEASKK